MAETLRRGRMLLRVALPGFAVSLLYWIKYRCFISPKAEVDFDPLIRIGRGTRISSFVQVKASYGPVEIGSNVAIAIGCFIGAGEGGVTIGDDCLLGPNVSVLANTYRLNRLDVPIRVQGMVSKGIRIANNVWLGAGTVVLDGAEIGEGVVVAAHSVVTGALPANTVAEGNPAKVVFRRR